MLDDILAFLPCETPDAWLEAAIDNQSRLLIDHANCEKKAAAAAMNLMYRYTSKPDLLTRMSQLAREELLHFRQVVEILKNRGIEYVRLSPSRYASGLRSLITMDGNLRLVDTLIVGAFIEARSCERFAKLAPLLDAELERFYGGLLKSESRHYADYILLAKRYSESDISTRVAHFAAKEAELINRPDDKFRFHSGVPA
ncbi:MAG: tRNA-(ms[2]io[6]A)-hydroxylase [Proteobacteria bacterium]|nr:tRNA-(ms[2]io[6]A)-hydroxylase [Pseudomonadota bacterium]